MLDLKDAGPRQESEDLDLEKKRGLGPTAEYGDKERKNRN